MFSAFIGHGPLYKSKRKNVGKLFTPVVTVAFVLLVAILLVCILAPVVAPYDPNAQDLTQDVFVHIWDTAGQYRPTGSPVGWILAVCRNLCLMHLRRESRQVTMEDQEWHAIPDNCPGLDSQERLLLQDALAVLGEEERRIVLLHTAGLKHREIGQALGLPLATVLSKYHRALKKMRAYMEGDDAR